MAKCSPARKARLRERAKAAAAEERTACAALKAAGKSCSTCEHRGTRPIDKGLICELDSDFQGYRRVPQNYVCSRFQPSS
jgi:hypothetical protein